MTRFHRLLALALLASPAPALAQGAEDVSAPGKAEPAEAPAPVLDLSFELTAVSDYRFRGLPLSDRDPALQGGATLTHRSGLYAGAWASTIAETAGGAEAEVDLSLGYAAELGSGLALDATLLAYLYPDDADLDYVEGIATASLPVGPATPSLGVAYAPRQSALRAEDGAAQDNLYLFGALELPLAGTPLTLTAGGGWEKGAFDLTPRGGKWDWQAAIAADFAPATLSLAYVDSDARADDARGRNLAGAGLVLSLGVEF